jgi:hypothetical protein
MSYADAMARASPGQRTVDRDALVACINPCSDCAQACTACADACLAEAQAQPLTENRPESPRLQSGDEWPSWLTNICSRSQTVCGTAGHAETSRWAARLGRVGLLHVVAKRGVAPIGGAKNLLDLSGQSVNRCIRVDLDCADICAATLRVQTRQTAFDATVARSLVQACAAAYKTCGDECEIHAAHGMEHCRICAEACRRCEQDCQRMLSAPAA